jgi:ubiquitin carboxyl-terminal hydrolase 4/11
VTGQETDRPPVLLLTASTTAIDHDESDIGSPIFPVPEDDMDVDSNGRGSADGSLNGNKNHQVSGRKRLASGLANLGNTCFMNSTLQCLAHTEPIRRYFLSGEYEKDLNRDNPLGTGGELATQFANLMGEIWGVPSKRRNVLGNPGFSSHYSNSSSSAVYPRSFKFCLGKHAEQFVGYDQHDSQELATYLLDALHEDTNRVTKKPYVEKPEQGEDEPDDVAADKAWSLHLKREDSRVLENFMGQVKSRLECCRDGCDRVSTTFDPFMYLSVPIPGASERTIEVFFLPLDPIGKRIQKVSLTLPKTSTIAGLLGKLNENLVKREVVRAAIPLHDLVPADMWSGEIFSWHRVDDDVDRIRDTDKTFVFQVRPIECVRDKSGKDSEAAASTLVEGSTRPRLRLQIADLTRLNDSNKWMEALESYMKHNRITYKLFNPNRSTHDERLQFYKKLDDFIDECHTEVERGDTDEMKCTTRVDADQDNRAEISATEQISTEETEEVIQGLVGLSNASETFANVKTPKDVAILQFCANKLRNLIIEFLRGEHDQYPDGILIQVLIKSKSLAATRTIPAPLVLRLPAKVTVYGLREELAIRLSRSIYAEDSDSEDANAGESSAESSEKVMSGAAREAVRDISVMRQTALTYERKTLPANRSGPLTNKKLGMVDFDPFDRPKGDLSGMAVPTDEAEQASILEVVGHLGTVYINWTMNFFQRVLDESDFFPADMTQNDSPDDSKEEKQTVTVLDCIQKYCQKEQLEETEKWYCNKCKDHVRAWKQFHLYRAPPILIVHLKRFHYSAATHRRDKISTYIDFPLEGLDLTELVSRYGEDDKPVYDCYAVSNHYGGLGGGHYTAYTLSDDGSWCYYDDSRVTTNVEREKVVSEAAYVLYYRRRDVPIGNYQDYIYDGQTSPMICEQADGQGEPSEMSSNNTAQAGDMDVTTLDDLGSNASSRTATSPMGSIDNSDKVTEDDIDSLVHPDSDHRPKENAYPLQ